MQTLPGSSPFDDGDIVVTRFYCPGSDVTVEGRFEVAIPFAQLNQEQLQFVETFVKCEGKLSRMEGELGLSYPTIRNRLHEVIRAARIRTRQGRKHPFAAGRQERHTRRTRGGQHQL